jgi:hypothetical protein
LKHVIKEQNQGNILLQGKWNNFFEKSYGCKSCFIKKKLEKEVKNSLKGSVEGQLINKCPIIYGSSISNFLIVKSPYKLGDVEQQ